MDDKFCDRPAHGWSLLEPMTARVKTPDGANLSLTGFLAVSRSKLRELPADRLAALLDKSLTEAGVAHRIQRAGNMFSVFFGDDPVTDFASARASQTWRFPPFFHALLDAGVYPPCSAYEAWFVSAALTEEAFDHIAAALPGAARAAAAATEPEA